LAEGLIFCDLAPSVGLASSFVHRRITPEAVGPTAWSFA